MNIGFVGTGAMVRRLLASVQGKTENIVFSAAFSRNETRRDQFQNDFPGIYCYQTYAELLSDSTIDAVYIATPVNTHPELTIEALESGKHVLCEKPMATTIEDCKAMVSSAEKNNRILQIGYMMRFHPIHQRIKKAIQSGELGTIRYIHVERTASVDFKDPSIPEHRKWFVDRVRSGGGVFWDLGSHLIDLLLFFTDDVPRSYSLLADDDDTFGVETEAGAFLQFKKGTFASLFTSWKVPLHDNIIQVYGEKASLFANRTIGPYTDGTLDLITLDGRQRIDVPYKNHYLSEFEHFKSCTESGREPITSGKNCLPSEEIRLKMYGNKKVNRKSKW